jgi:uncharacterized protein involved in exopolysaccharide biosynthesis
MDTNITFDDIKGIVRRCHRLCLLLFCPIFILSILIAIALPPVYLSKAMILIEEQQIHQDYVKSTITSYAQERLEMITREIMKYSQLKEIIEKFGLYKDLVKAGNLNEAVGQMQKSISVEPISFQEGFNKYTTVAFRLSYEGKDQETVQKVTDALSQLYLNKELKSREKQVSITTDFLGQNLEALKKQVKIQEEKISEFKSRHIGELPENIAFNMQNISRLEMKLQNINTRIRTLEDRKIYLKGQLATIEPLSPVTTEQGKLAMNPKERLKGLRLDLVRLQARLSNKHPDIRKIKAEIAKLEQQVGQYDESVDKIKMLSEKKARLAEMQSRLSPKHPDMVKLKKEIEILTKQTDKLLAEKSIVEVSEEKPDNPAYINILTQIVAADAEIKSLKEEAGNIKNRLEDFRAKVSNAPLIEKEYNELTLNLNNAKQKYTEISNKLMSAQVAQQMEEQQIGEKFTILEPANFPYSPHKPNRIGIIMLGFILACFAALGVAAVKEGIDNSFKNENELVNLTDLPVLATLELVETKQEKQFKRLKTILITAGSAGLAVIVFIIINTFFMSN